MRGSGRGNHREVFEVDETSLDFHSLWFVKMMQQKKKNIKQAKKVHESIERALWEAKAIKIDTVNQFKLASGNLSPIYVDCRKLISYPNVMDVIAENAKRMIEKEIGSVDVLAGGETAGIPFAAWVAAKLGKSMAYVRKEKKGYGAGKQVEGDMQKGEKVLLVEDLITDGGSKIVFIDGIRNEGGEITDCLVVFDRQQGGGKKLAEKSVKLWALTNLEKLLKFGLDNKYMSQKDFDIVRNYLSKN